MRQVAQGDLLFIERRSLFQSVLKHGGDLMQTDVIAYGEHTGHSHRVFGPAKLFGYGGVVNYFVAQGKVQVRHEEHAPVDLDKGIYEVRHQKEFDYKAKYERDVVD